MDRFSKYSSAETFENANASIVSKFFDNYIQFHGVPRFLRIVQAPCVIDNQVKTFCVKNINLNPAPAKDHRAVGSVELSIITLKQCLAFIKEAQRTKFVHH